MSDKEDQAAFDSAVAASDRGDYAEALVGFRLLAEKGHADAQFNLGLMYDNGQGVSQNYAEAVKWFCKAAEQYAQNKLGIMYDKGIGGPQDDVEAAKWLRKAAEQGFASVQGKLGLMYQEGKGVPQNFVQAHKWFNLAAAQGDDLSKTLRDTLAEEMSPSQTEKAQRLAAEWKPKKEAK